MKVRLLRKQYRLTQQELADTASLSLRTVQKIEAGHSSPRGLTFEKLTAVFKVHEDELARARYDGMNGGRDTPIAQAGTAFAVEDGSQPTQFNLIEHLLDGESELLKWSAQTTRIALMVNRRDAMFSMLGSILTGAGLTGANEASAAEDDALQSIQHGLDGGKLGGWIAEWARSQIDFLNQLDIGVGGKMLYPIARSNLNLLRSLLQMRVASGQDELELRLALAHMASQTGWFAEDAEMLDQAEQYYHFALELARSAGGHDFAVYSLTRLAATSLAKGRPAQCLSQLEIAESEAGPDSPWRSFINMFAVEAHGRLGNVKAAQQALAKADALFDRQAIEPLPEWAFWVSRPSSSSIAARSFIPNDPRFAARLFEDALEQIPLKFARDRSHLVVGLARAKQNLGELDEALDHASEALRTVAITPLPRVEKQLIEFHAKLPADPLTESFRERFVDHIRTHKPGKLYS